LFDENNRGRKSRDTVPLRVQNNYKLYKSL
jgi:hypothetical protein